MTAVALTPADQAQFHRDGFVVVPAVIDDSELGALRERIEPLFNGEFSSGLAPDEVNWQFGRDADALTRQLCNVWKADHRIASTVLRSDIGKACAQLAGWPGARLNQDNLFWKPPGAGPVGFHQDCAYEQWVVPNEMVSCWLALDDTSEAGGTVEYIRGSHRWGAGPRTVGFHSPVDAFADVEAAAAAAGVAAPERVHGVVRAGDAIFHHGWTWHGSETNCADVERRSLVVHCMSSSAQYHATEVGAIYSRYKRFGDTAMDESFFPITWREDHYRSPIALALSP